MEKLDPDHMQDLMGGMNYHVPVTFEDGVVWFCRIRRNNVSSPPLELQNRLILSEAATLQFLSSTSIPVPKIHDFATASSSNPIGVGYILMEKLPGRALDWNSLSVAQKTKFLRQFADIFSELARHMFPSIGCLNSPDNLSVGPLVAEHNVSVDEVGRLHLLGPFSSVLEYRVATIKHQISLILERETYAVNPVDAYLIHLDTLDNLLPLARKEQGDGRFYLKHMDDKGDHILVDNDLNIVGILDWEWAQTTSKAEAFSSPLFLLDVGAYYDGENKLSTDEELFASILEEKGLDELASYIRAGRVEHRMMSCVGGDGGDPDSLPLMFAGLRSALRPGDNGLEWKTWKEEALAKYKNDSGLKSLLERTSV